MHIHWKPQWEIDILLNPCISYPNAPTAYSTTIVETNQVDIVGNKPTEQPRVPYKAISVKQLNLR